ncbi:MAG: UpxY family transcription antiterminator [Thermodesulfovibrio sp.]|nr:UpxY family transcription antiterminator [Thermodesulfovibrio sp.]MDW7971583.1 UpxY family transcription antiterminator [Thermodesulfovibrio sp.]
MGDLAVNWYCIYVKSRHEFKVFERLTKAGIEAFLPAVERLRRWKDRKKLVKFPLFPGYLFVCMEKSYELMLRVLKTPGVVSFIKNPNGEPEPVPEDQIVPLKKAIENNKEVDPYPYLKEGQEIKIKRGPLAGVKGILKKKEKQHYLIVSIHILQRSVSIRLDASEVELV